MQKRILENFWYGNIRPFEQTTSPNHAIAKKVLDTRNALCDTLSIDQKNLLEAYESAYDTMSMESAKEAFAKGFQLSAQFLLAALDE